MIEDESARIGSIGANKQRLNIFLAAKAREVSSAFLFLKIHSLQPKAALSAP